MTNISILTNNTEKYDDHCLYASTIATNNNHPLNLITTDFFVNDAQNIIIVNSKDFPLILNTIIQIFLFTPKKENEYEQFISKSNTEKDLHKLINEASLLMDRSLVLLDLGFQIIDYSTSVEITDPIWKENIKKKEVSYEFIKEMNKLIPEKIEAYKPFYVNCTYSTENKLCTSISYHNTNVGYLVLLDNNKGIESFHIKYLPGISQSILKALENLPGFSLIFSQIISDLFRTILRKEDNMYNAALELRQKCCFPETMYCICFNLLDTNNHSLSYIKNMIRSKLNGYTFLYNNFIVSILEEKEISKLYTFTDLQTFVKHIAISQPFHDLLQLSDIFSMTKETIEMASLIHPKQYIYYQNDYRTYCMLTHCENIQDYIHPKLLMLEDQELFETLKIYVQNGCNIQNSATQLFIHRNTLTYRLKKICELTQLDLEDHETIFELNYSFKIIKLLELKNA